MLHLFNIPHLILTYGYIGVFVIAFLESGVFFMLPGDSLLFTAGLLAATTGFFSLWLLIPMIIVASFLGGMAGYIIGIYIEKLHKYQFFRTILSPEHIMAAHRFFEKYGIPALILSRFVPIVRTFTPIAAGVALMDKKKFLTWSFVGAIVWSLSITLAGFFLGHVFPQIQNYLTPAIVIIILLSIVPGVYHWYRSRGKSQADTTE